MVSRPSTQYITLSFTRVVAGKPRKYDVAYTMVNGRVDSVHVKGRDDCPFSDWDIEKSRYFRRS